MDLLAPGQWDRLADLLVDLTAATGLALTAAFAFLLGHVVLPAFAEARQTGTAHRHENPRALGRLLDLMATAAVIATLVGLGRAVVSAADVLQGVSPHPLI